MKRIKIVLGQIVDVTKKVKVITNKPRLFILFDLCLSMILYGASPNNYYFFGFYKINLKKRSTFVTNRLSEKIIKKFNDNNKINWFEDKKVFNDRFKNYICREYLDLREISENKVLKFYEIVKNDHQVIYKPYDSSRGRGIQIINYQSLDEFKKKLNEVDRNGIIENWIKQNELLNSIYKDAVNCIRVITLVNKGIVNVLACNITFGNENKISNASQNDLVCLVSMENGEIMTNAVDSQKNIYKIHPKTNKQFKGVKIPYYTQIIEMVKKAAMEIDGVGYIGWDIAVTNDGPVIIEGNTTPGYIYFQLDGLLDDYIGRKKYYLKASKF